MEKVNLGITSGSCALEVGFATYMQEQILGSREQEGGQVLETSSSVLTFQPQHRGLLGPESDSLSEQPGAVMC